MTFDVVVDISLRPGISDPEGATIERSCGALGFDGISGVAVGKTVRFRLDAGLPVDVAATGTCVAANACASDAIQQMELGEDDDGQVTCTLNFDPGRRAPAGKPGKPGKPRLITKAHPARGGPDLRGLQRIP